MAGLPLLIQTFLYSTFGFSHESESLRFSNILIRMDRIDARVAYTFTRFNTADCAICRSGGKKINYLSPNVQFAMT